jgi:hypothetical protein
MTIKKILGIVFGIATALGIGTLFNIESKNARVLIDTTARQVYDAIYNPTYDAMLPSDTGLEKPQSK